MISMATGLPYDAAPTASKRAITLDQEADEGVMRSMARRKKNAPPMDINQKCAHCDKVFKRPCDLTKHEKTHSRPWKCTETDCKYHEIGWPTEKERDRHINDKHAESPIIFRCDFAPCTYHSKRQSNCKQHMEKAHGWKYERAKNNSRAAAAKGKLDASLQATPATPGVSTPASGQTSSTPSVGPTPSPFEAAVEFSDNYENVDFDFSTPPAPAQGYGGQNFFGAGVANSPERLISPQHAPLVDSGNDQYQPTLDELINNQPSPAQLINNHPYQLSAQEMNSGQVLYDLNCLQAQFAAGDPDSLIPQLMMEQQFVPSMSISSAESVPELMGPASASNNGSPMAAAETSSLHSEIDWSAFDLMGMSTVQSNVDYQVPDVSTKLHGLSPAAQGNIMLYSPETGLAQGNVSHNFPFGHQDFTLYGEQAWPAWGENGQNDMVME